MEPDLLKRARSTPRGAVVLGATLALGSCSFAGCGDDVSLGPKMPPLASTSPSDRVESEALALPDVDADEGRVEQLGAAPGFVPDPLARAGITAGGPVDAREFDDRCTGWMAAQPDFIVDAPRPFAELSAMVASPEDVSLMIVGPDGEPRCGDDEDGVLPVVRGPFPAGRHRVWIGAARRDAAVAFTFALSELDGAQPSRLGD